MDKNSRETTSRLQNEMAELNEIISNITQELNELKRNEERLSILAK
jgi:prefoldin subunit 5